MLAFPSYNYEGYFKPEQVVELKSAYEVMAAWIIFSIHGARFRLEIAP